jgi:ectoine hydroxylase-related dioxygenase (phytanoyl-CoA dioxygenase family)
MAITLRDRLKEQGYVTMHGIFQPSDLDAVSQLTASMIAQWQQRLVNDSDYWSYQAGEDTILYRIHHLETKHELIPRLVEYPPFKRLVHEIVGEAAVPTAFALVIKMPGRAAKVPWHRDPIATPPATIFNFSIYLDESDAENGCLAAIPGSHLYDDAYVVSQEQPDNAMDIPAHIGDVIVHDVRLVHGSGKSTSLRQRRSIIIEFRPGA